MLCLVCWLWSSFELNSSKLDADVYVRRVGFVVIMKVVTVSRNILQLVCLFG